MDKNLAKLYRRLINTDKNNDALELIHSVRGCNL